MNFETATFAVKLVRRCEDGSDFVYAQRIAKTQGRRVLAIWNSKPHNASLFTYDEAEAILHRFPLAIPVLIQNAGAPV